MSYIELQQEPFSLDGAQHEEDSHFIERALPSAHNENATLRSYSSTNSWPQSSSEHGEEHLYHPWLDCCDAGGVQSPGETGTDLDIGWNAPDALLQSSIVESPVFRPADMSQELNVPTQRTDNSLFEAIQESGACSSPRWGAIHEASIGFANSSDSMIPNEMTAKGSEVCAVGMILSENGATTGPASWDQDTFAIPKLRFELDSKPANDLKGLSAPHAGAIKYLEQLDTPNLTSNVVNHPVGIPARDSDTSSDDDLDITIGSVLKSGRFKCPTHKCRYKSFGRKAELQRHYNGTHAPKKRAFWCPVPLCKRSVGCGGKAFHREDKLRDHTRTMHDRDT